LDNDELLALIEHEEAQCVSATSGQLAEQRREAMQFYLGQPYGDEVEGRSSVVTTEVKDAIEGIMPALMAIFTSSDQIVRFEPQGMEDEEAAQQATDYINYIFSRLNNGFVALYCLIKDALLQKNGYLKVYWEDYSDQEQETYENLNLIQYHMLTQDPELELVEVDAEPETDLVRKAVFKRTKNYGKVCVDPIPPEEVLISRDTPNDLSKARFVEHRTLKTLSEIRKMGFDVEDDISGEHSEASFNMERQERLQYDESWTGEDQSVKDPSLKKVWLCEAFLYVDFDGDGIAEYRKVTKIGKKLLDNVPFDSLPIIGGTAIMMPHKHYGLSIHDLIKDVQVIKSTVTRQLLDNAYVANNGRMEVLDGMVNMDDLLTSRPNGIVRTKVLGAMKRVDNPLLGAPFYNLLEYFDRVKVNRVGARDFGDAVDPNALNAKAHTAELVESAAQARINLMARIFAEGPIKALFWKILELTSKHQDKAQQVKLRGKWIEVDPREWKNKFNMTVTVGLGTGSQQTVLSGAKLIMEAQFMMLKAGLGDRTVNEQNLFQAAHKLAKAVFPKDADAMFTNPATLGPRPPQPPPIELLELQEKARKADMANAQRDKQLQAGLMSEDMDRKFQSYQQQFDAMVRASEQQREEHRKLFEAQLKASTEIALAKEDKSKTLLQGRIDEALQTQQAKFDAFLTALDARLNPKPQKTETPK
jgi:hypothetical protein